MSWAFTFARVPRSVGVLRLEISKKLNIGCPESGQIATTDLLPLAATPRARPVPKDVKSFVPRTVGDAGLETSTATNRAWLDVLSPTAQSMFPAKASLVA